MEKDLNNALADINKSMELDKIDTEKLLIRAIILCKLENYNKALEDLNKVLAKEPKNVEAKQLKTFALQRK